MDSLEFHPPEELAKSLRELEHATGAEIYFFGGVIRDRVLQREARDIDLLYFGDLGRLRSAIEGGESLVPHLGTVAQHDSYNVLVETSGAFKQRLDFIDARSFLSRYGILCQSATAQGESTSRSVGQAVNCSDFTINGAALSVRSGHHLVTHPLWESDLRSRIIRPSFPTSLELPLWPGLKALVLTLELGGSLAKESLAALSEYSDKARWRNISPDRLYDQLIRLFSAARPAQVAALLAEYSDKARWRNISPDRLYDQLIRLFSAARPAQVAALLAETRLLEALFPGTALGAKELAVLESLELMKNLPGLGIDGRAPWFIAAYLSSANFATLSAHPLLMTLTPEQSQSFQILAKALPEILRGK